MNSSIIRSDTYQSGESAFTVLPSMGEGSRSWSSAYRSPSSWKKFIHAPAKHSGFMFVVMVVPSGRTTTEGPVVLKPAPTTKELLNSPLFQVAGMFAIDEPGWADRHDEYLAETHLESHADSE